MKTAPLRPNLFWGRLAAHALWLHGAWEAVQCAFFYDMTGVSWEIGIAFMALATLADGALTCGLVAIALRLRVQYGSFSVARVAPLLMGLGAIAALGIEALAQSAGWWRYLAAMPTLEVFGWPLGILPLLQMALLPVFALIFSSRERPRS